jgi:hypothetical protein
LVLFASVQIYAAAVAAGIGVVASVVAAGESEMGEEHQSLMSDEEIGMDGCAQHQPCSAAQHAPGVPSLQPLVQVPMVQDQQDLCSLQLPLSWLRMPERTEDHVLLT